MVYRFDMLTRVIQFTGLVGLIIKPVMFFFIVFDPLIFLIIFFHSYSILDWLRNEIHDFFFLLSIGLSRFQINIFLVLMLDLGFSEFTYQT
jgi:hypothetical protein